MKLCKLLALGASYTMLTMNIHACAPAHQSMEEIKTVIAIAVENANLKHKLNEQSKCSCCDTLGEKCNNAGNRTDKWCFHCFAQPCQDCLTDCADRPCQRRINWEWTGTLVAASTICLPYTLAKALCCGTTYICCDAKCSEKCLGLKD